LIDADDPKRPDDFDVVFFATPDGVGKRKPPLAQQGVKVVDYSGDFRFNDSETYKGYATRIGKAQEHASPDLLPNQFTGSQSSTAKRLRRPTGRNPDVLL